MTRPSSEVLAVSRRWIDSIWRRRPSEMRALLSDRAHLRFVGSGEGELWAGAAVRDGIAEFFGEVPEFIKHEETFAEAFENGDTGWTCFTHDLILAHRPDRTFHVRTTLILALEDGQWKIVHRHGSVPFPNLEFVNSEQTAIAKLVAAAREGFSLDQREGFATIMFTDIVNSSRLAATMGDRLWSSEITRHFAALRRTIEGAGGQFVKSLGDGTMSSFHEPAGALGAAQEIMQNVARSDGPAIALRIGIHAGNLMQTEDDFFGTVVNKAARVAALAAPGEIRVSDTTRAMVGDRSDHRFADAKPVHLDGFEEEHVIHRLLEAAGLPAGPD
jgi:class 3 adenylate cyclase